MAWPLGKGGKGRKGSTAPEEDISLQRLEAMTNVGYEEVPLPDEGELTDDEAWMISPSAASVRIGSQFTPSASGGSSGGTGTVQTTLSATVDTKSLERLLSSRLDMVEDTMRSMSYQIQEVLAGDVESHSDESDADEESTGEGDDEAESLAGDRLISSSGEVIEMTPTDDTRHSGIKPGSLMELYEAQALSLNPFLRSPESLEEVSRSVDIGPHNIAALLLDNLTGLGATSFLQKAVQTGMLNQEEYSAVIAIVHLAEPGVPESGLEDRLPNRELLTLSALLSAWRSSDDGEPSMEG